MPFNSYPYFVFLAVAAAVGYVARGVWKTWFGRKAGCASACGGKNISADNTVSTSSNRVRIGVSLLMRMPST